METQAIALVEVEWFIAPTEDDYMPSYRHCDLCYESAMEDIWDGKPEKEFRRFFQQYGGVNDGLAVCEHCLDEFLSEPME